MGLRVVDHPIIGRDEKEETWTIVIDGRPIPAKPGETIAATLLAHGLRINRYTPKLNEPRGLFCAIGQCTDCVMVVNGVPNVKTCVTPVRDGMKVETQHGLVAGR